MWEWFVNTVCVSFWFGVSFLLYVLMCALFFCVLVILHRLLIAGNRKSFNRRLGFLICTIQVYAGFVEIFLNTTLIHWPTSSNQCFWGRYFWARYFWASLTLLNCVWTSSAFWNRDPICKAGFMSLTHLNPEQFSCAVWRWSCFLRKLGQMKSISFILWPFESTFQ